MQISPLEVQLIARSLEALQKSHEANIAQIRRIAACPVAVGTKIARSELLARWDALCDQMLITTDLVQELTDYIQAVLQSNLEGYAGTSTR